MDPLVLLALSNLADEGHDSLESMLDLIHRYGEIESREILNSALSQIDERIGVYKAALEQDRLPQQIDASLEIARRLTAESTPQPFTVIGVYMDDEIEGMRFAGHYSALTATAAEHMALADYPTLTIAGVIAGTHHAADAAEEGVAK